MQVAPNVGVKFDEVEDDTFTLTNGDWVDVDAAMQHLNRLVDLLPRARAYSVTSLARVFSMFAPIASAHPNYVKVRDGLDAATAGVHSEAVIAKRCRDRAMAFINVGRPLEALAELHNAKVKWFNGDTMYGAVVTMRFIGKLYADLGLMFAAKMYTCAAAAVAIVHGDLDVKPQVPMALLEAAKYAQRTGSWADAAGLTEVALMARAQYLTDPFDLEKHPELADHQVSAALELSAIRTFCPSLEPVIAAAHPVTDWFAALDDMVKGTGTQYAMSKEEYEQLASEQLNGPLFGDMGPTRIIKYRALDVLWLVTFDNDRHTVLNAEGFCAALQVYLADIAHRQPAILNSTVSVKLSISADTNQNDVKVDRSNPEINAQVVLSSAVSDIEARALSLIATCVQLLDAVHARPLEDLKVLTESMLKEGLSHKIVVGRPYEETADLLEEGHYSRCAAATRPTSSNGLSPFESSALSPSTSIGPGHMPNAGRRGRVVGSAARARHGAVRPAAARTAGRRPGRPARAPGSERPGSAVSTLQPFPQPSTLERWVGEGGWLVDLLLPSTDARRGRTGSHRDGNVRPAVPACPSPRHRAVVGTAVFTAGLFVLRGAH